MRLIDADTLYDAMLEVGWWNNADRDEIALPMILSAPNITADRPSVVDLSSVYSTAYKSGYEKGKTDRPRGEWIDAEIPLECGGAMPIQVCSLCKTFYPLAYTGGGHRFCPNCGADMRKENSDEVDTM